MLRIMRGKSKQIHLTKLSTTCQPHQIRSIKKINRDFPLPAGRQVLFFVYYFSILNLCRKELISQKN